MNWLRGRFALRGTGLDPTLGSPAQSTSGKKSSSLTTHPKGGGCYLPGREGTSQRESPLFCSVNRGPEVFLCSHSPEASVEGGQCRPQSPDDRVEGEAGWGPGQQPREACTGHHPHTAAAVSRGGMSLPAATAWERQAPCPQGPCAPRIPLASPRSLTPGSWPAVEAGGDRSRGALACLLARPWALCC